MVLQFYIDDSGNNPANPVFVLGGFMSSAEMWATFSCRWSDTLRKWGVKAFKAHDAMHFFGEFRREVGWDADKRNKFISELMGIVEMFAHSYSYAAISWKDYGLVVSDIRSPVRRLSMDSPYTALFNEIIINGVTHVESLDALHGTASGPVEFIFDQQIGYSDDALLWFPRLKEIIERSAASGIAAYLGPSPVFRSDDIVLPLQAADLCAWHVYNQFARPTTIWTPSRGIFERIEALPGFGRIISAEELSAVKSKVRVLADAWAEQNPTTNAYSASEWKQRPKLHRKNALNPSRRKRTPREKM